MRRIGDVPMARLYKWGGNRDGIYAVSTGGATKTSKPTGTTMRRITYLSTALKMLEAPEPVDLVVWTAKGETMVIKNCVSLHYDFYNGTRNVKILQSGQIRKIRDVLIKNINGLDVFL